MIVIALPPDPHPGFLAWVAQLVSIGQGLVLILSGIVALFAINAWRRETIGKRKIELAEAMLAQIYQAKRALDWATEPTATPSDTTARIQETAKIFVDLNEKRFAFRAYFGTDEPIDKIFVLRRDVTAAAAGGARIADASQRVAQAVRETEKLCDDALQTRGARIRKFGARILFDKFAGPTTGAGD